MVIVSVADAVHVAAGNSLATVKRGCKNPTGSETVARYQKECIGTWETQCIPEKVCNDKPENGEEMQKVHWESDQLIVAMKQGNACGAKGLAGKIAGSVETSTSHRTGFMKKTQTASLTCLSDGKEVFLKSRVRENRKHGSVRGFVVSSARRWL
ncbi:MAG: hypothetical protein QME74_03960 [Candidatus Edwardsbacteria bacterium]|nr:hypothetical protein [Candidatus Edwardsbacteria bacterium]